MGPHYSGCPLPGVFPPKQISPRIKKKKKNHQRTCGSGSFYHSGPDIVIHWASGDVYYDFTIVHELSQSNVGRSTAQLFRIVAKESLGAFKSLCRMMDFSNSVLAFGYAPMIFFRKLL